jgi:transcription elongation factor GreA
MPKQELLTEEGQQQLLEELTHLETVRRREVGERIKEAKEFGDLSENSEYEDAMNGRVTKVALGSHVQLKDHETGETHTYRLVGSAEADPANDKISNESPVGKTVIGAKKGDIVKVTVPSGKVLEYEVMSVRR